MERSKKRFLRYVWVFVAAAGLLTIFSDISSFGSPVKGSFEEEKGTVSGKEEPKEVADLFLEKVSGSSVEKLRSLKLSYDLHMELDAYVKAKMNVSLEMKKERKNYTATFSLTEPEGKDLWSRFVIVVFAQYTAEYQEMIKAVETRMNEKFHLKDGRFVTEELEEVLPKVKKYENQTGMKVRFDCKQGLIKFWEDQTKEEFNKAIKYTDQVGPMTGFFNFLLFEKPEAEISVINALKRAKYVSASQDVSPKREQIEFIFGSQVVRLQRNDTGRHSEYDNVIYFQDENYLDIIYGKNVFFELAKGDGSNVKIPYAVMLDGIISKKKKREKEERLRRLMEKELGHEIFEDERRKIEASEELAAKDVKVYLKSAEAVIE